MYVHVFTLLFYCISRTCVYSHYSVSFDISSLLIIIIIIVIDKSEQLALAPGRIDYPAAVVQCCFAIMTRFDTPDGPVCAKRLVSRLISIASIFEASLRDGEVSINERHRCRGWEKICSLVEQISQQHAARVLPICHHLIVNEHTGGGSI